MAPARTSKSKPTRKEARANQRHRMLAAIGQVVGRRGYAETSVAHVIERAGVSRKAFYEYFTDKEDCFLIAYEAASARVISIVAAVPTQADPKATVRAQLRAYLDELASEPILARAFNVEAIAAGPRILAHRETVNARFADLFVEFSKDPVVRLAMVGGVEIVIGAALHQKRSLSTLFDSLSDFLTR
jgi:AcrR family transcriptional regulator